MSFFDHYLMARVQATEHARVCFYIQIGHANHLYQDRVATAPSIEKKWM